MSLKEVIYLIVWILLSFGLAFFLFKKVRPFRRRFAYYILILTGIASVILHNLISAWYEFEERAFFSLAIGSFATAFFLFSFRVLHRVRKRDREERGE